ncbi:putative bifunctional diguanylate cyclase/phosphodiesterase [Robertmurraya korlensis]|uniref:putative bifunctional diguanylate cyclase/phosphodiesterase n=1 Tax=Robertmurraya korlensis TaxID=519977 RepID=UPI0008256CB1|nr:EAL domain-containing protein [Robertmurraya korlensis]
MFALKNQKFAYLFIAFFIITNFLWNYFFQHKQAFLDWGGVAFQTIACLTSLGWLLLTYKNDQGKAKNFWLFLGLGILSYIIGILIWVFYEFILGAQGDTLLLPKLFWIGQNGFYFVALLYMMKVVRSKLLTIRFSFDMLIIMTVATTFNWVLIISPLLKMKGNPFHLVELMYPILDLGVLGGVISLFIASNSLFNKKTLYLLVVGLLVQILADSIFSFLTVNNLYTVGSISEPLWILSLFILALAGLYHETPSHVIGEKEYETESKNKFFIKHSLPYVGVVLLSLYVISHIYTTAPFVVGLFLTILLVVLRQLFTLLENNKLVSELNHLNEQLEVKVKERTDRLVETINQMEYLAYHDVVTGLPNRRFIEKRLSRAISNHNGRSKKKIAFLLLDLDRFKHINDSLGHSYGDLLLKEVGDRLSSSLKPNELVCRIGGDEYGILLENTNELKINQMAEDILTALRKTYDIRGEELYVTPSIGVSIFPDHGNTFESLLMKADTAMYKVKEAGKNHYKIYNEEMDIEPQVTMENALRKGIERNELELFYQPQVSLENNQIVGVEALLRWIRPEQGMVPPCEFIPLAEETGLILPIGEWVLKEACLQSVAWEKQGLSPVRIAVNISAIQFKQSNFIEKVTATLFETKANPEYIELEITESVAMGSIEDTLAKLQALKEMGFYIAIDDFGTGYSSLQYLNQYPIDRLKIDRSFISSLNTSEKNVAIVKLIVLMAKGLNYKVIAEGVEEESQKVFLRSIDCDEFQGYLFSPPLNKLDTEALLLQQLAKR